MSVGFSRLPRITSRSTSNTDVSNIEAPETPPGVQTATRYSFLSIMCVHEICFGAVCVVDAASARAMSCFLFFFSRAVQKFSKSLQKKVGPLIVFDAPATVYITNRRKTCVLLRAQSPATSTLAETTSRVRHDGRHGRSIEGT